MKEIEEMVAQADAIVITAGAGMGVDSGLPDFRGTKGLWKEYPDLMNRDLDFEEMANPKWFHEDAKLAWAFYGHRLHKYLEVQPHAGFEMLLELCRQKSDQYFVITSNVDNHFQKAGFDADKIHEVHGSLAYFQCVYGCKGDIWPADYESVKIDPNQFLATAMPTCPYCSRVARPNVLMFDDYDWLCDKEREQRRRFETWSRQVWDAKQRVLVIELGAGKVIATIRRISERLFQKGFHKSDFIRINPRDDQVPEGAVGIKAGALEGIKRVVGSC